MTPSSALLFVMLLAVALSPFVLAYQVTRLAHSRYRNALWIIRDHLVDDLRTGRVQTSPGSERLLDLVETHINIAGRHTLADSLLAVAIYKSPDTPSIYDEVLGTEVPLADRTRLTGYLQSLRDASVKHLSWASVSGWTVFPIFRLLVLVVRARLRRQPERIHAQLIKEPVRQVERVEVQLMPKLMPSRNAKRVLENGAVTTELPC